METRMRPELGLSTKSQVWGDQARAARESTEAAYAKGQLREKTLRAGGHKCVFCGFTSTANEVHNLNDNHRDITPDNLAVADSLCHAWQHLGELGEGEAFIAYLPGLSPRDANHLQRTIMVALLSDDAVIRDDAKQLLNWMASHRDYTTAAWGTNDPSVFAAALTRLSDDDRVKRDLLFNGLAVVVNPGAFGPQAAMWAREDANAHPVSRWPYLHHDVMYAPG